MYRPGRVAELLETLVIVGQARRLPDGRYTGRVCPAAAASSSTASSTPSAQEKATWAPRSPT